MISSFRLAEKLPSCSAVIFNAVAGKLVNPAPDPTNAVEVNTPVEGTKLSLVEDTFCGRFPVLAETHVGYTAVEVETSLVMFVLVVLVAMIAVAAFPVVF